MASTSLLLHLLSLALLVSCATCSSRQASGPKVLLDSKEYQLAKCLDGSPGAFYVNTNTETKNATWVIYLEGGGECVNATTCKARSTTSLGSSALKPNATWFNYGLLDTSAERNPHFSEANFVRVAYCSGDLWLGSRQQRTPDDLYFQGRFIVRAVLATLVHAYGMGDAELIVFGGSSAGGIGALALMDEMAQLAGEYTQGRARFVGSIQGGYYFLNDVTYQGKDPPGKPYIPWGSTAFPTYVDFWGAYLPHACVRHQMAEPWKCIVADYSFQYVETPVFVAEALTDKAVMPLHCGLPGSPGTGGSDFTPDERDFVQIWSNIMSASLRKNVIPSSKDGLFAIACWTHTSFEEGRSIEGKTHLQAIYEWLGGLSTKLLDPCGTVLCNPSCPIPSKHI